MKNDGVFDELMLKWTFWVYFGVRPRLILLFKIDR